MTNPRLPHSFSRPACGALLLLASLVGCQNNNSSDTQKPDTAKPNYQILRAGHPPFSMLVTTPGKIAIFDFNDQKYVLKKTPIAPNTLITINPTSISLNITVVTQQQLDRHHTYEIRQFQ